MMPNHPALDLSETNVLITGGCMGIGYAAAEACLRAGTRVLICARGRDDVERAAHERSALGDGRVAAIVADVTQPDDIARAMDDVASRWRSLNAVIHSAGIYGPIGPITDVDPAAWLDVIQINLFGAFLISKAAVGINGKFVAAPYDGYRDWPARIDELAGRDLFTLRRIVPRDRGRDWQ